MVADDEGEISEGDGQRHLGERVRAQEGQDDADDAAGEEAEEQAADDIVQERHDGGQRSLRCPRP